MGENTTLVHVDIHLPEPLMKQATRRAIEAGEPHKIDAYALDYVRLHIQTPDVETRRPECVSGP